MMQNNLFYHFFFVCFLKYKVSEKILFFFINPMWKIYCPWIEKRTYNLYEIELNVTFKRTIFWEMKTSQKMCLNVEKMVMCYEFVLNKNFFDHSNMKLPLKNAFNILKDYFSFYKRIFLKLSFRFWKFYL